MKKVCLTGLLLFVLSFYIFATEIILIHGENNYTGFRTDNISNPGHLERCTWKNHWATNAPFIGENTWRADVADYCC
jgi:hypothetical protein